MLELFLVSLLQLACGSTLAAMGACSCPDQEIGQFALCAGKNFSGETPSQTHTAESKPIPMKQCRYYANGTIDIPTMTVITAMVPVGSRYCIGDVIPTQSAVVVQPKKSIASELTDEFRARVQTPRAEYSPKSEIEFDDPVSFWVEAIGQVVNGELFDQPAQIRFRSQGARWEFSDGESAGGMAVEHRFEVVDEYRARAFVAVAVDYRLPGDSWVLDAVSWELPSNDLLIRVIERRRVTLLVE